MSKQPTATAFVRKQESWAKFILDKIDTEIEERETSLRAEGWSDDKFDEDPRLVELYEDSIFYERYAEEMGRQREHLHKRYLGEGL